jgi:hypothetical protein
VLLEGRRSELIDDLSGFTNCNLVTNIESVRHPGWNPAMRSLSVKTKEALLTGGAPVIDIDGH